MARVVEFIGPSGAGKTTTYAAVRELWRPNETWIPLEECLRDRTVQPVWRRTLRRLLRRPAHQGGAPFTEALRFMLDHPLYTQQLWQTAATREPTAAGNDVRFDLLRFMFRITAETQRMLDCNLARYVVHPDGLIHNLFLASKDRTTDVYSVLVPDMSCVDVVIQFKIDQEELLERVIARKKKTFLERGLSIEQLREKCGDDIARKDRCIETLGSLGIPVHVVNAAASISQNAVDIVALLDRLE